MVRAPRVRRAHRLRHPRARALSWSRLRPLRREALPQLRPVQGPADRGRAAARAAHRRAQARVLGRLAGGDHRRPSGARRRRRAPRHLRQSLDGADPDGQPEHPHRPRLVEARQPRLLGRAEAASAAGNPLRGPAADRSRRDQPQSLRPHGPADAAAPRRAVSSAGHRRSRQRAVSRRPRRPRGRGDRLVAVASGRARAAIVRGTGPALVGARAHRQVADTVAWLRHRRAVRHRLFRRRHRLRRVLPAHRRALPAHSPRHPPDRPGPATQRDGPAPRLRRRGGAHRAAPRRGDVDGRALRHLPAGGRR